MVKDVELILSKDVGEVIASPLSLKLLRCYSTLYLGGKAPRTCSNSQRKYYQQLKKNGIEMAKKLTKAEARTCTPAWKGLKYIPKAARHYSSNTLTDEEARALLDKGFLKESDFNKLPDDKKEDGEDYTQEEQACIKEFIGYIKEGKTNAEMLEVYKGVEKIGEKKVTKTLLEKLFKEARKQVNEATE